MFSIFQIKHRHPRCVAFCGDEEGEAVLPCNRHDDKQDEVPSVMNKCLKRRLLFQRCGIVDPLGVIEESSAHPGALRLCVECARDEFPVFMALYDSNFRF